MSHLSTVSESQSLRKRVCLNTPQSLLDQWGKIEILPEIGGATKMAVRGYYGIPTGSLDWLIQRHRSELRNFGYKILSKKDFENFVKQSFQIPNRGLAIFPPPAIFCIGLLLRDSMVAKNLRSGIWEYLQNRGIELIDEEVLMESRSLRDELCLDQNLGLLDRVGALAIIDDTAWSTVEQVSDFYRVGYEVIKKLVQRNRKELKGDGYRLLSKKDLAWGQVVPSIDATTSRLAIFPRRAILRVGMLLRDSEVAKDVRSYLLNVESQAPWRQKKALDAPQNSAVSQTPDQGTTQEEIIGLLSTLQQEIKEEKQERQKERQQDRKEQKVSLKDLEQTIRKLIWNLQETVEKRLDFVERDSKGISQSCQSFYLGILGDFEDLKGQKGWENKGDLLSRLTDTIWKRLLADLDRKFDQIQGRMNYFWQEIQKEQEITKERIRRLEDRLARVEERQKMKAQNPGEETTSFNWKERFKAGLSKMIEDFKNLTELLED